MIERPSRASARTTVITFSISTSESAAVGSSRIRRMVSSSLTGTGPSGKGGHRDATRRPPIGGRSVVAELGEGPAPEPEIVEIRLGVADRRIGDEVEPRRRTVVGRLGIGCGLQVQLPFLHFSCVQILVE